MSRHPKDLTTYVPPGTPLRPQRAPGSFEGAGSSNDAIYRYMDTGAQMLRILSQHLKGLVPMDKDAMKIIRKCHDLASDLEMETFKRRGS